MMSWYHPIRTGVHGPLMITGAGPATAENAMFVAQTRAHDSADAGHFAWEQAADDYGRLVVDWVRGGYRQASERRE